MIANAAKRNASAAAKQSRGLKPRSKVGKRIHDTKTDEIAAARFAPDRQSEAEENRWDKQRAEMQAALDGHGYRNIQIPLGDLLEAFPD